MIRRYCAVCQARVATWSWQPDVDFALSRFGLFSVPGQHHTGYPIVSICDECYAVITRNAPVVYTYRGTPYRYADGQSQPWTRADRLPLWEGLLHWLQERRANKQPMTGLPEEYRELLRNDEAIRRERARLLKHGWRPRDEAWQVLEDMKREI
jgi:hypothetical protein